MTETKAPKSPKGKKKETVSEKYLKIRLVRSPVGYPRNQRIVAKGLGLGKLNSEVIRRDGPEIWGMIRKIVHLVKVEAMEKK